MNVKVISLCALSLSLTHCGKKSGDDDSSPVTSIVTNVAAATSAGVNAAYDATDALADDANSAGIALLGDTDVSQARTCVLGSDGTVSVAITFSGTGTKTITRAKTSAVLTLTAKGDENRVWTPASGQSIACTSAEGFVKVNWKKEDAVEGLKLAVTVSKTRTTSSVVKTPRAEYTVTNDATIKGSRSVNFSRGSLDASLHTFTKTVTSNVTRISSSTDKDGQSVSLTAQNLVAEATPLNISIVRSASTGALQKKTLNSGTLISTMADGTRAKSVFSNLVFDLATTNANKCQPTSGTVTVSFFDKDATVPAKSMVLKFGDGSVDSSVSVAFDGGEATDYAQYNAKGCDLENES